MQDMAAPVTVGGKKSTATVWYLTSGRSCVRNTSGDTQFAVCGSEEKALFTHMHGQAYKLPLNQVVSASPDLPVPLGLLPRYHACQLQ
jgi:hypothetical protein